MASIRLSFALSASCLLTLSTLGCASLHSQSDSTARTYRESFVAEQAPPRSADPSASTLSSHAGFKSAREHVAPPSGPTAHR